MRHIFILLSLLIIPGCSHQKAKDELIDTMSEMISLINQGKHQELLSNYCELPNRKVSKTTEDKMKKLKVYLLKAKELTPQFSKEKTMATYEHVQHGGIFRAQEPD